MTKQEKEQKFFEIIVSAFFMAFSIYMLVVAYTTEKVTNTSVVLIKAMTMPKIVLWMMLGIAVLLMLQAVSWYLRNRGKGVWPEFKKLLHWKVAVSFALVVVYALSWEYIGFSIATFIFFAIETKLVKPDQSILKTVIIALLFAAAMYLLFGVAFKMFFPEPILDLIIYG